MRIIVCGGRRYTNGALVYTELDKLHEKTPIRALMHGGAHGADRLAREWAHTKPDIIRFRSKADWLDLSHPDAVIKERPDGVKYDAMAGHRRNAKMLSWGPDLVVAFPGDRGTHDMIDQATKAGVPVLKIGWEA